MGGTQSEILSSPHPDLPPQRGEGIKQFPRLVGNDNFHKRGFKGLLFLFSIILTISLFAVVAGENKTTNTIIFTQVPKENWPQEQKGFAFNPFRIYPLGSRIVTLTPMDPKGKLKNLTPEFSAAGAPEVSFDAQHILFAGKRTPDDRWSIYEMNIDGSNKREITSKQNMGELGDCTEPRYLAKSSITPPDFTDKVRWIVFASTTSGAYDEHGKGLAPSLYVCTTEPVAARGGYVLWRATFNLGGDSSPWVLRDGRVLYTSWQHHGNRSYPNGIFNLMAMDWSGTGLNPFYGSYEEPLIKTMPCELSDRTVAFVESDGSSYDGGGQLTMVSLKHPLHSAKVLSKGEGRYRSPYPLADGGAIVAYTPGEHFNYGIYTFDIKKGKLSRRIYDDPDWHDVDAVAVYPRPEPTGLITMVEDDKTTADLYCLNSYESDLPEAKNIQSGQIKKVRLVEGIPLHAGEEETFRFIGTGIGQSGPGSTSNGATSFIQTRIIGEAPVERDGSFLLKIVADTPFFIQTLDENNMALQTMRSWIWVRRRDQRGCIGCHEDKELAPENRAPEAIVKAQPTLLVAPPEERRTVDFRRDVMPIIQKKCTTCHSGSSPAGRLDLGGGMELMKHPKGDFFNRAYENLIQPISGKPLNVGGKYIHPGSARNSPLIWMLFGKQMGEQYEQAPFKRSIILMPPNVPLTDAEKQIFVEWIDLGAQWDNIPGPDNLSGWNQTQ